MRWRIFILIIVSYYPLKAALARVTHLPSVSLRTQDHLQDGLCVPSSVQGTGDTDPRRQGRRWPWQDVREALWEAMKQPPDNSSLCAVCPFVGLPDYVIPEP